MSQPFSIARSRCAQMSDASLRDEIQSRTENEEATSRILRSIERFGVDPSIERYEIAPHAGSRAWRGKATVAWTVRAIRETQPS